MKRATIIYNSKTGITRKFGDNIRQFLNENYIESEMWDIKEFNDFHLLNIDFVFLGCWTSGLLLFMQKPEKNWVEFAKRLPLLDSNKTILFTTYKIHTGSMFKNMKKHLKLTGDANDLPDIASRDGSLSDSCRKELVKLIKN